MQKKLISVDKKTADKFRDLQDFYSMEESERRNKTIKINQDEAFRLMVDELYQRHVEG